jgi:hypothetical protein
MENNSKNHSENSKGCKVKKTYPKWETEKQYESIVSLERLEKAIRTEGHIGI